jgi:hypothetical protein
MPTIGNCRATYTYTDTNEQKGRRKRKKETWRGQGCDHYISFPSFLHSPSLHNLRKIFFLPLSSFPIPPFSTLLFYNNNTKAVHATAVAPRIGNISVNSFCFALLNLILDL